jgi:WD40 repeat protein/serine/threonine protein kinase
MDPMAAGAEAAFASYVARVREGEDVDFDAFCDERPVLADALRRLHAAWGDRPTTKSGRVRSIREFLDDKASISLDPEAPPDDSKSGSGVRERLDALAARTGRYTLRGEVARGGMGVILKVWDEDLRRTLAMKASFAHVKDSDAGATDEDVNRFLEEAQITGQLDHPGVPPVHELGVDEEGRLFFTMRLVRGKTLDEIIRLARDESDGWNRVRALMIVARVCEAMAYAHSKGVIHRDIKPANVMVGKFGEVYVMDWGLAKVIGRPDLHDGQLKPNVTLMRTQVRTDRIEELSRTPGTGLGTMQGTIIGTPSYMPPEQAEGRIDDLDPRSDVYSVGALLYTLLTGRMPYVDPENKTSGGQVLMALLAGPPAPVHDIDKDVPPELVAVCDKAMARDPADRYETIGEFAEDLRAYVERRVVKAYETGALAEFRKWVVRNKAMAAAVAALLLVAVGGSFFVAWQQKRRVEEVSAAQAVAVRARGIAEKNAWEAVANAKRAEANLERAARQTYLANLAAAHASLRMYEPREALRLLDDCPEEMRGWEWRFLRLSTDTSEAVLTGHEDRITTVAFSPDGARIVSGADDCTVRIWDVADAAVVLPLSGPGTPITAVAHSGARIAAATKDGVVYVWDADGRLRGAVPGRASIVRCLAFSADGTRIATGDDRGVRIFDADSLQLSSALDHDDAVYAVAFGPDGKLVATGTDEGVAVWDVAAGRRVRTFELEDGTTCLAFGARIAAGSLDARVHVFDPTGTEAPFTLSGHADPVTSVAWAPDGRVVSASYDKTVRVWDLETRRARSVLQGHAEAVLAVACDGGNRIVSGSADGTLRLWRVEGGEAGLTLRGDEDFLSAVAFHPDGKTVAAASAGHGEIRIWDARTGAEVRYLPERGGGLSSLAFSSDGARVVAGGEEDAVARILDTETGDEIQALHGHEESVACVAFAPGDERVATGSADNTARIWDAATGETLHRLEGHTDRVTAVAFSADGRRLLTASRDGTARVWDAETGALRRTIESEGGPVRAAIFDPRGERIVLGCEDGRIRVFLKADLPVQVLEGHADAVASLAFNQDGTRLVSGGHDKTVRVWDDAGRGLLRLLAHDGWVTGVAFAPDGESIASSSFDTTAKVWRTKLD